MGDAVSAMLTGDAKRRERTASGLTPPPTSHGSWRSGWRARDMPRMQETRAASPGDESQAAWV